MILFFVEKILAKIIVVDEFVLNFVRRLLRYEYHVISHEGIIKRLKSNEKDVH